MDHFPEVLNGIPTTYVKLYLLSYKICNVENLETNSSCVVYWLEYHTTIWEM